MPGSRAQNKYLRATKNCLARWSESAQRVFLINNFYICLTDDLNSPKALAIIHSNLNEAGKDFFRHINQLLGLNLRFIDDLPDKDRMEIERALAEREKLRAKGNFGKSDELRKKIEQRHSIEVLDTAKESKYYPV